ncbi:DNA cross-link repair protein pso2/snm1 like [Verticillium longisporum]|nr:DNA cross-link repair protein pso2/snm1 like [Verticillium longisporum]
MALRIDKVIPTVNVGSEQSRKRMKSWIDRWMAERRRGGLVRALVEGEGQKGEGEREVVLWEGKDSSGGGAWW